MKLTPKYVVALACLGLSFNAAAAQFIANGDMELSGTDPINNTFEDGATNIFAGWYAPKNAVSNAPVAISGNHSARVTAHAGVFYQLVNAWALNSDWVLDLDFACAFPTGSNHRVFNVQVDNSILTPSYPAGYIICRAADTDLNRAGEIQVFDGAWHTVFADAVTFSTNCTNAASMMVNHLQIVGHYTNSPPSYDMYLTNALGVGYSSTGWTTYYAAAPQQGAGVYAVEFPEGLLPAYNFEIVDNISLTGVLALLPFDITEITASASEGVVLRWQTIAGYTYQVQSKIALSDTTWTDEGSAITATDSTTSATNAFAAGTRFYRVVGH